MKITKLRAFALPESIVLRIETDSGLRGYGECRQLPARELALLKQHAIGADPSTYEVLRIRLADAPGAQAALNMAMLDVLGKQSKAPIYSLLGGATRNKVRLLTPLTDLAKQTQAGERAFLVPVVPPKNSRYNFVARTVEQLVKLREQAGDNVDFVLDGQGKLPPAEAGNLSAALEKFHLLWFDEPCPIANLAAVRKLARENVTPLGFGRTVTTPAGVPDLFREQAIDVLRLDIRLHGISQIRRLAALAETYYTAVAPYNDGGPIASAAAIQLAASIPNFVIQQVGALSSPIVSGLPTPQNGFMPLPTAPGLGITINDSALERFQEAA
jgi:galactonate dehydratase